MLTNSPLRKSIAVLSSLVCGVFMIGLSQVPAAAAGEAIRLDMNKPPQITGREHVAITDGPCRFVRHPGYAGMLVSMVGAVALLGKPWAGIPLALYVIVLVVRTRFEDETLAAQLPGYQDYRSRTRYRLIPGLW